jgi:hypothetical protein
MHFKKSIKITNTLKFNKMFKRTITNEPLYNIIAPENFTPRGNSDTPQEATTMYRIPEHQRFPSWSLSKKQKLVDSILRNYPIHAFIMVRRVEKNGEDEFWNVEDGQTRMTSLQEYLLDGYPTEAGDGPNDGKLFSELDPIMKERFKNYSVAIETFHGRGITNDVISEIFNRLNSGKPLGSNEKFHSRMNTPILEFFTELKSHPELRENIEKFIGSIGTGKTRKGLSDIIGMILAIATRGEDSGGQACINTSYEQNYKYLKRVLTTEQKADVIAFLKAYFVMLHQVNDSVNAKPKKQLYGKLSGVLGLSVCSWVQNGFIRGEIAWYIGKLIHDPKYEPSTFRELAKGDLRNCQGPSVARRLEKIVAQYETSSSDNGMVCEESEDDDI